ncbi:transporter substrate-binding domain-containing protein [Pseudoalteromonas sp. MMG022]|uniref:substrate-binding periplasmic protein n=1 Tax=Pseudoalteromonas sp. MMG022 TaxID=2909978 RepID=UPI001F3CDE09|nr:transporter substrate-binding domain-containing protein [Pseudoalteromonas sp. MMG022]MCF6437205.1 transporter substrate-binding domain-containing protein [Pseudoalteromonas sp. MMG022]
MRRLVLLCLLCSWAGSLVAAETIYVAKEQRTLYDRDLYLYELLEMSLKAAGFTAQIEHVKVHPHQQRTLLALSQGDVDLHWSMTSPEREQLATAIPVPLFKGFIGKRALLINKMQLSQFEDIDSLQQLAKLTAVQGHDWPDTKILGHNHLHVRPMANYQAMFAMVSRGRLDYFPRSFIEVGAELATQTGDNLVILPTLYLQYPSAFYFFVNKDKPQLANALTQGLAKLQATGEFDALFERYFAKMLAQLPFDKDTKVLMLQNPYFRPPEKRDQDESKWALNQGKSQ